ncbi:MAG: ComF family protein [Endomicrobiales bacterium]|nr:ComF family protein [Endomicrobiales bacterium]
MQIKNAISGILKKLSSVFFPLTCAACGRDLPHDDELRVCAECRKRIELIDGLFCNKCGTPLPDGGAHCYRCRKEEKKHFESIRSACRYEGLVRGLVHKFKYKGRAYIDEYFGRLMTEVFEREKLSGEIDAIVPVPMHPLKKYVRGYDQSELLAAKISRKTGKRVLNALRRKKRTKPQFALKKNERNRNVEGSFACVAPEEVSRKGILLVDDVVTTGATIEECAKTLKKSGAGKVYALTLARD